MKHTAAAVAVSDDTRGSFLKWLERVGNKLPNPAILFLIFFMVLALCSYVLQLAGVTAVNLKTNEIIHIRSLISAEGLDWLLTNLIKNYINFPPLGMIIVLTFGLGVASETGLLQTLIHHSMHNIPRKYVTLAVVFISLMSHIASDAAIVIMPPLAAMLFYSMGRHPLVGFACSLAAIYSGFTANILIVTTDVLLSGITTQAIRTIDATMTVTPIDNWYFMSFAVFYLTAVTTFITEKFVEPRMGVYDPAHAQENLTIPDVSPEEKKALRHTLIAAVLYLAVVFLMAFPDNGLLRNPQTHSLLGSPLLRGVIPLLCGFLLTVGLTYGVSIGKIKNADDMIHCMTNAVKGLSGFLVMAFFIAQFIAAFAWTNMSTMIAMKGALFLKDVGMTGLPALICFMLFGQLLGLFTSSGSAVWALLSTVFVPMFMLLGYHPAFIQAAFRAGDGALNTVALVNPFLPLFLEIIRRYKKDSGIGTYLSLMMPYAMAFLVMWYALFIFWYLTGWPVGPGIPQRL
ncbi:AbgT family transporter [Megasphaera butyrica]|uniref:AbgT family transporter n=1 Tax=Megasphaera butyrica TaxID=2981791 RepID=UPI000822197D|nr:AbgT family transporter [Megasphaera butyrica]MCU6714143.1 AbgT family transporter [Megasphaera butyrica]SCH40748.1 Aminobenzoyl-glutamate transport protein [uncultured Megasphaera sp.]SCJ09030.1 Aminobenzoyl-glutamate transport protein [uncultured Ruminococcus sp.]